MKIGNWLHPRRARFQRAGISGAVVLVGLLLTNAAFPLVSTLAWCIAGGIWGFVGVLAAHFLVDGKAP